MAREDNGSAGIVIVCILIALGLVGLANEDSDWTPDDRSSVADDGLSVTKELRLSNAAGLPAAVAALGGPVDKPPVLPGTDQAVIARVRWTGPDRTGGWYQLVVLDNRVRPARPLRVLVGWNENGEIGNYWTGGHEDLVARYEWLAGLASAPDPAGGEPWAVGAPATAEGSVAGVFPVGDAPPFKDPEREVLVVLFYVDSSGEVRWARSV